MQMHEADELLEVDSYAKANVEIGKGWSLLAVVSAQDNAHAKMRPAYILGRRKGGKALGERFDAPRR